MAVSEIWAATDRAHDGCRREARHPTDDKRADIFDTEHVAAGLFKFVRNRNMPNDFSASRNLAVSITRTASMQADHTIRFLVDRDRAADAYRAYGYFRWVDDCLDRGVWDKIECPHFIDRQSMIVDRVYRGGSVPDPTSEEQMVIDLIHSDRAANSGLQSYIRNMLAVMAFDAERRGRLISDKELTDYTQHLAVAVTDALHYFIGNHDASPQCEARYSAATGAHIMHMLRDTLEDTASGYYNIPREYLESHAITPHDITSEAYRAWIGDRVELAQHCFAAGRQYLMQVENLRCRIAGFAYIARFEGALQRLRRADYLIKSDSNDHISLMAGLRLTWSILTLSLKHRRIQSKSAVVSANG
jgi:phytoene/squalene synthetase